MSTLSSEEMLRLVSIFKDKGWNSPEEVALNNDKSTFNRICSTLEMLQQEERNLIIELLQEFKLFKLENYETLLKKSFSIAFEQGALLEDFNKFYIVTLPKKSNEVTKSQDILYYILEGGLFYNSNDIPHSKFTFLSNIKYLPQNIAMYKNECIVVVDDFIGTGETVIEGLKEFEKRGISKSNLIVISLVAMREGIEVLNDNEIIVYSAEVLSKGISDKYYDEEKDINIKHMKSVEKKLEIDLYNFGYKGSEALVKLLKTPDNTFPVFWRITNKNKKPVFERRVGDEQ